MSKRARIILIIVLVVCLLPVVFVELNNWLAKHEWEKCKAGLEAKGEHLDYSYFVPPHVPDDQNFALTPLVRPLLGEKEDSNAPLRKISIKVPGSKAKPPALKGWNTGNFYDLALIQKYYRESLPGLHLSGSPGEDMLSVYAQFDPLFKQLREDLASHPQCCFPVRYDLGMGASLPHLTVLQSCVSVLARRACAELQLGRSDDALADLQLAFQLVHTIQGEPSLIGGLVRITMDAIVLQPVWEGISAHRWTDAQLAWIENELLSWDFLADYNRCMRMERTNENWACDQVRKDPGDLFRMSDPNIKISPATSAIMAWVFKGSIYRNQILMNSLIQDKFLAIMNEKSQVVNVANGNAAAASVSQFPRRPSTVLAAIAMPVFSQVAVKFTTQQNAMNMAAIACEIERYRLAHGAIPAMLADLHMARLPHDIINGQPLHYLPAGDNYRLYSVGWNKTDDGGAIVMKKDSPAQVDYMQGDWVWTLGKVTSETRLLERPGGEGGNGK